MAEEWRTGDNNAINSSKTGKSVSAVSDCRAFTNFDVFCVFFSMGTFVADLTTDIILAAEYWRKGHMYWSLGTLLLILVPAILIQLFSMRWHLMDEVVSVWHWITHICLVGVLHRYTIVLKTGFEARGSKSPHDYQRLFLQQSDICMLHLFESFLEAAPQLILQLYIMVVVKDWHYFTGISAVASLCSLSWAVVAYVRALRRSRADKERARGMALLLQAVYRSALLAARLSALLLFAVGFEHWIFALLGIHWIVMTVWVIQQKTDFCPSQPEEIFYNCVVGVIYCFCFFNLREGQARYRMIAFYVIMVTQNISCFVLFLFFSQLGVVKHELLIVAASIIIAGTSIGIACMLIYYRWFHPSGPIEWWGHKKESSTNIEESNASKAQQPSLGKDDEVKGCPSANNSLRSLKSSWQDSADCTVKFESSPVERCPPIEAECTDKKLLLDHFIARAGSPAFASVPADITGIEFYSVANTPESDIRRRSSEGTTPEDSFRIESDTSKRHNSIQHIKNKRRGICSPTELGLRLSKTHEEDFGHENGDMSVALSRPNVREGNSKSRREDAGCENDLSREEGEVKTASDLRSAGDPSEGKTSSESADLELDVSFSDVDSLDIDEFNENIVQKLCLSTLKSIKNGRQDADIRNIQKIALEILRNLRDSGGIGESEAGSVAGRDLETPSEALSAHDYENICAVNIAREAWGLRSWRACPDMGGSPLPAPPPLPARRPAPVLPEPPPRPPPVDSSHFSTRINESAQFYSANGNSRLLSPPLPLESVPEEVDEFTEGDATRRSRRRDSESALVATIDEIRNETPADSPRNVYHRPPWDSPLTVVDRFPSAAHDLRRRLWREPASETDIHSSGPIVPSIDFVRETVEIVSVRPETAVDPGTRNFIIPTKDKSVSLESKIKFDQVSAKNWIDIPKVQYHKRTSEYPHANIKSSDKNVVSHDISNDIYYDEVICLSEPYKRNPPLPQRSLILINTIIEDGSATNLTSSLQSLIERDERGKIATPKESDAVRVSNKKTDSRPRRKFSLLRERFEPKSKRSDEEKLFQSLESVRSVSSDTSGQNYLKSDNALISANQQPKIVDDKENLTPLDGSLRDPSSRTVTLSLVPCDVPRHIENPSINLKEKRTIFLKQVLSPPKISGRNKKS